jgi:hypothetical protein
MPWVGLLLAAGLLIGWLGYRLRHGKALPARTSRLPRVLGADLRRCRQVWPAVLLLSALAVVGHVVTFLIAARTAGVAGPPVRLVPLALLVLLAMAVPLNLAGWGPREGAAAWTFGAAGLGAAGGLATAAVYGVLVLVANLPGALVLLADWWRASGTGQPRQISSKDRPIRELVSARGGADG